LKGQDSEQFAGFSSRFSWLISCQKRGPF